MNGIKLRNDAEKSPVWHAAVIWLFAVGLVALPVKKLFALFISDGTLSLYAAEISVRALLSAAAIFAVIKYRFGGLFGKFNVKSVIFVLPALIVAVNNFPIIASLNGEVLFYGNSLYTALFIINCLFIGVFEETVFRGLIFPLIYLRLKGKKFAAFLSAAISSAVFAASHLVNLLGGASVGATFLQVGYSFLIGGMCAVSVLMTGNIFTAMFLHFVYDVGGLILIPDYAVAEGFQWNTPTVIITVLLGVAVAAYMVIYAFYNKGEKFEKSIYDKYACGVNNTSSGKDGKN